MKPNVRRLCCCICQWYSLLYFLCTYEDEVASNIGCAVFVALVRIVEIANIVSLQDEHDDPVYASDNGVQGERGVIVVVLTPNCVAFLVFMAVIWGTECVVYSHYYYQ